MKFSNKRRELLRTIPAGVLMPVFFKSLISSVQAEKSRNIRWAQGWLLWRNFKAKSLSLRDAFTNLHDVGFDGIEFSPGQEELARQNFTVESLKELLASLKLTVSGNYFSAPFHETGQRDVILQQAQTRFQLLKEFGARNMIIGPPSVKVPPAERTQLIKQVAVTLNELGKRALNEGIQIGIHPHLNTLIESPAEIDMAMEATDPRYVFFSPDTGHIYLAGGDLLSILKKYHSRINYFHFKDGVRPFVRPKFEPNLRELGQGEVDFPSVMRLLKKIHFRGWVNVEQDATQLDPQQSSKISARFVKEVLQPIYT